MFYVMIEITAYRQLKRLKPQEIQRIYEQLISICSNRGGKFLEEEAGMFLFSFHPAREKVLKLISEFIFSSVEILEKNTNELFGYSIVCESVGPDDVEKAFFNLKNKLFLIPFQKGVWAGPEILPQLRGVFPLAEGDLLTRILGPQLGALVTPLTYDELFELTGWGDALGGPLDLHWNTPGGRILRIRSAHSLEKLSLLLKVLQRKNPTTEVIPVIFPIPGTKDALSQLLALVDSSVSLQQPTTATVSEGGLLKENPQWDFLLKDPGSSQYPGDHAYYDIQQALKQYFLLRIDQLLRQNLPPIFVVAWPSFFSSVAVKIVEEILADLVDTASLKLLILENLREKRQFLSGHSSVTWDFPVLTRAKVEQEIKRRSWISRVTPPGEQVFKTYSERGASITHWMLLHQEGKASESTEDPSWIQMTSLDRTHQKVYYAFHLGAPLLNEKRLMGFFESMNEDPAVIQDKVENLRNLGFLSLGKPSWVLRPDFLSKLSEILGDDARVLASHLGQFLYEIWAREEKRGAEIVFRILNLGGEHQKALTILSDYVNHKINRGEGDFLPLLRPVLWESMSEIREQVILSAAAFKLRFAMLQVNKDWKNISLDVFKKHFTPQTENFSNLEWTLQTGRLLLLKGQQTEGFALLKKALLLAQEQRNPESEIVVSIDIGQVLLSRGKSDDAHEYFDMAALLAEAKNDLYNFVRASFLDALTVYLAGDLSGAMGALEKVESSARKGGMHQFWLGILFIRARMGFDLGRYQETIDTLGELETQAKLYDLHEAKELAVRWRGRCLAYLGEIRDAHQVLLSVPSNPERECYRAEVALIAQDYETATKILKNLHAFPVIQPFYGERLSFSSGYALLEDRLFSSSGERGVLEFHALALKAYLGCLTGQKTENLSAFSELLANKHLVEISPFRVWIYLWYSQSLETGSEHEAQRLTLLGRGLKALQTRASNIRDPYLRQEFQNRPHWNSLFLAEAKKSKLL
jgi:tetratricopeptide (TPR) repeat protein